MSKDVSNPLQALVNRAGQTLPPSTGKTATQRERLARRAGSVVILADVSASMEMQAANGVRKIDLLREAVNASRGSARLFAFSAYAREVEQIPDPEANTNLAKGLETVRSLDPGTTLVISDGEPDNESAALSTARNFRGAIDVLYIGPESNTRAIAFMQRLAKAANGQLLINDVSRKEGARLLTQQIAGLLPGPRP